MRARLTTTCSPSLRSRRGERHAPIMSRAGRRAHMDHVAGPEHGGCTGVRADLQPAVVVDTDRPGRSERAAGQLDPHVAPDRVADRPVRRRSPARVPGRRPPRVVAGSPSAPSTCPSRAGAVHVGRAGRAAATWRSRTGSSAAVVETLSPTPTTAAGPAGRSTRSTRMPAELRARPSRTSLGHFNAQPDAGGPAYPLDHRDARSAAAATATARLAPRPGRAAREKVSAARGGVTQVRSSRPRPAVWWSATTTRPSAAPGACPRGDDGVGRRGLGEHLDGRQPRAGRARRRRCRVERWAAGSARTSQALDWRTRSTRRRATP